MFNFLRRTTPFRDFLKSNPLVSHPNTPDEFRLDKKRFNWVLEYGELMNGFPKHNLIGCPPVNPAFTVENFSLWANRETGIPVALKFSHPNVMIPKAKIGGELYALTKEEVIELDIYRQNGVSFHRKEVKILIPDHPNPIERRAFLYLGGKSWEDQVKWDVDFYRGRNGSHFILCDTIKDNHRKYYHYCALSATPRDETCFIHIHKNLDEPKQNSRAA